MNPHFLFNSLNSIRALVVEDPPKAQEMVTELSNLRLEKIRFEDRLRFKQNIDAAALPVHLAPMLLQTLVENAVKHGISKFIQGGELNIQAALHNAQLCIHVTNPGQLSNSNESTQLGLKNARERLELIYGSAATLQLRNADGSSVEAILNLPEQRQ